MNNEQQPQWISGFWRRVGAFIIDVLLLGLLGFLLGLVFAEFFVHLGDKGRLIGIAIALAYFGILNSKLSGGQTVGKRLMKLRVVNRDNETIALGRSFLRFLVLAIPFSLNGIHLSDDALSSYLIYLITLLLFGGTVSILYLYLFNRVTRQTLHDLVAGTYVVNAQAEKQEVGTIWKLHYLIVALVLIGAAMIPGFASSQANREPFKNMLSAQSALEETPGVRYATLSVGTQSVRSVGKGEATTTRYVSAQVYVTSRSLGDAAFAHDLAELLAKSYPDYKDVDVVQVALIYGFDIGIWSQWSRQSYNFKPGDLTVAEQL